MKAAVLYYSLTGNTRLIASAIADEADARPLEIELKEPYRARGFSKYLRGGRDSLMKRKPDIQSFDVDAQGYDLFFIGTPVWAGTYVPAVGSALDQLKLHNRKLALFCCSMGGRGRTFKALEKVLQGNKVLDRIHFVEPMHGDKAARTDEAREWARGVLSEAGRVS